MISVTEQQPLRVLKKKKTWFIKKESCQQLNNRFLNNRTIVSTLTTVVQCVFTGHIVLYNLMFKWVTRKKKCEMFGLRSLAWWSHIWLFKCLTFINTHKICVLLIASLVCTTDLQQINTIHLIKTKSWINVILLTWEMLFAPTFKHHTFTVNSQDLGKLKEHINASCNHQLNWRFALTWLHICQLSKSCTWFLTTMQWST